MRHRYTSIPLLTIISDITPFNKITAIFRRGKKVVTVNQWVMLVVPNTAVVWPSREKKKGKGLCQLSKGRPHSAGHWGGPPLLLHSGRRDFFRPQGDRGPGGVGLHCAWPGQPGWGSACSGGPSAQMSAHAERTLESDGKKKKKKKTRVFTVKGPQSDHWGIYWTPTVDFALLNNDWFFLHKDVLLSETGGIWGRVH